MKNRFPTRSQKKLHFSSIFNRIFFIFNPSHISKNIEKPKVFQSFFTFSTFFVHSFFSSFSYPFLIDIGSQSRPKPLQKPIPKIYQFLHRFFIDFQWIWDPTFDPSWPMLAPSWPSWRLLGLLLLLLGAILAPRSSPGAPQSLLDPPRPQFSSILGPFWEGFRLNFH